MAKITQARGFGAMSGQRYGSFERPQYTPPGRIDVSGTEGGRHVSAQGGGRRVTPNGGGRRTTPIGGGRS